MPKRSRPVIFATAAPARARARERQQQKESQEQLEVQEAKKREERERLMATFKAPSKAVLLGNRFLTNLGDQKVEVAKKAAKMDQRAARMASSKALV